MCSKVEMSEVSYGLGLSSLFPVVSCVAVWWYDPFDCRLSDSTDGPVTDAVGCMHRMSNDMSDHSHYAVGAAGATTVCATGACDLDASDWVRDSGSVP